MTEKIHTTSAALSWTRRVVLLVGAESSVTTRTGAVWTGTLVDLCIGIPKLDGDVTFQLILEANSLNTRDGLHYG
jgi:hypothetical protein